MFTHLINLIQLPIYRGHNGTKGGNSRKGGFGGQ